MVSVIPQPVYMNSSDAVRMKVTGASEMHDDDDLKTPTVEELAFPGHKAVSITRQDIIRLLDGARILIQSSAKRQAPGFVNYILSIAFHLCRTLLAVFMQPGSHL